MTDPVAASRKPGSRAALVFTVVTATVFLFTMLMNGDHIGANAAIHWDARTAVCAEDPMPTKAELWTAREHVFDAAMGSEKPDEATYYFSHPVIPNAAGPYTTVRRYYSQVSTDACRAAFVIGFKCFGSPTTGILFFQVAAAISMAVGLGILLTISVTVAPQSNRGPLGWGLLSLFAAALAGEPVVLSLSRQMLTEPTGFLFLSMAWGAIAWMFSPPTGSKTRIALGAVAAACLFFTFRSRYTLAVAALAVTPLVLISVVSPGEMLRRWRSYFLAMVATVAAGGVLVAIDVAAYGPFIFPREYARSMVHANWLYFHSNDPYDSFWTAVYVNGPLFGLPVLLLVAGLVAVVFYRKRPGRAELSLGYAMIAVAGLSMALWKAAMEQEGYQPRHLFPFSIGFAAVGLLAFPWVRWRRVTAGLFAGACLLVTVANVASTRGPQRTTMADEFPKVFTAIMRDRKTSPRPGPVWKDLLAGYCDWADNRRLHDSLVVLRFAREHRSSNGHKSLLVVDDSTEGGWWIRQTAVEAGQPTAFWSADPRVRQAADDQIKSALAAGDSVYLCCWKGMVPTGFAFKSRPTGISLDVTNLRQILP